MKADFKETALAYINKRPLLHVMMIEGLKRGDMEVRYASGSGVLLYYDGLCFMSAEDEDTAEIMLKHIGNADECALCGSIGLDKLKARYGPKRFMDCYQAVYIKKDRLPVDAKLDIRKLDVSHIGFVSEHYHAVNDEDYIRNRLESGVMYGAYVEGKLAGFIGRHIEGSMGLLEVLPEYRRLGIGSSLEAYMTNLILDRGEMPFCQLITDNGKSLALQKKLGFEIVPERVYWIS